MASVKNTLTTARELADSNLISPNEEAEITRVGEQYAIALTPAMHDLISPTDKNDPIAKQFVPSVEELNQHPAEQRDPIGDNEKSPTPGLVHRYPDRVLLKVVDMCPVYCRFCFRREMVGPKQDGVLSDENLRDALAYIKRHPEIWEVIFTGGDPFVLSPRRIRSLVRALDEISHVKVLRWHTRVPVVAPERLTPDLIDALSSGTKTTFVAVHCNHARELTLDARTRCRDMMKAGLSLVSQTVLLRGINDDVGTLCDLMRAFVETGLKPYYLHHGDLAPGTTHFRVPISTGQALMRELRQQLSGLAQPTYVIDIPGAHGKVPAAEAHVTQDPQKSGRYTIKDANGVAHIYDDCCGPPTGLYDENRRDKAIR